MFVQAKLTKLCKTMIMQRDKTYKDELIMLTIRKLKQHFLSRQFLLFLIVGCINTFNGTFFAYLFSLYKIDANTSFILGYLTSLSIAYYLNCKLVFKEPWKKDKYLRFCLSYIPNFIIQNFVVIIFYNYMNFLPVFSYLLAAIIGVPVTFLIVKIFAFKR
jgi:putative flippase GtrA